jgi:hypothetical protein
MHIGPEEWQRLQAAGEPGSLRALYHRLANAQPDEEAREEAAAFLHARIAQLDPDASELPRSPEALLAWMTRNTSDVHALYAKYLEERRAGAPRRFFTDRAHALYVLRSIAPTKLVDGAWLYGLVRHWRNPRLNDLVRTYVEELGEGMRDKNHVVLYRQVLARYALDPLDGLDDALYEQGAIQLALGSNAEDFLPEVVGFNLAYEQLPLHLLITAYELNELGLDPYYFTLHVTVDNSDTGHARRACEAVLALLPRLADGDAFWRRVRAGAQLACAGRGTTDVIGGFDIEREALRILQRKAVAGSGSHSDYCRVAGRSINEWLREPARMADFVQALQQAGWIRIGEPVERSRFWGLLLGPRAEMFGVFSAYELQVLHDWIRGPASADGRPYAAGGDGAAVPRRATFRALNRTQGERGAEAPASSLDPDLQPWRTQLQSAQPRQRLELLVDAMSPAHHWTAAGLEATRLFCALLAG